MLRLKQNALPLLGSLFLLLLTAAPADAQIRRGIRMGDLQFNTNEVIGEDDIIFPQYYRGIDWNTERRQLTNAGVIVSVDRQWTDDTGVTWPFQVAQVTHNRISDLKTITVPVKGAFKRVFRNDYPDKVLDGKDRTQLFDRTDPVDPTIPSDVMFYNKIDLWPNYGMGMQMERYVYMFGSRDHDDYTLNEWVFTNTSSEPRTNVYIALSAQLSTGNAQYPGDIWGELYGDSYKAYKAGDASADSLRMWYSWSSNRIYERPKEDTRARPNGQWGDFREPHAAGFVVVHADASATDESDNPAFPFKAGWAQREKLPDLKQTNQQQVHDFLVSKWDGNPGDGTYSEVDPTGWYRTLKSGINLETLRSNIEEEKSGVFVFGPYNLQPKQNVRIVTAYVMATIPQRLAIDAGRAYKNGSTAQLPQYMAPLPSGTNLSTQYGQQIVRNGDIYDLRGNLIATAGTAQLTQDQKNKILDISKELLFYTASKAVRTWKSGDVKEGKGKFNIKYAPASPSLEGVSEGDQIRLKWSDNTKDAARGGTPVKWRIYREYKRPPSLQAPTDTTFLLLTELPGSQTEYLDKDVVRGEQYYYVVTAVNAEGLESNMWQNRTGTSSTKSAEALVPRSPSVSQGWQDQVVVVPNPFHIQGNRKYSDRRLNFLNLPAYARIHIYTVTGDRIQTIDHNVDSGDQDWQRQDTFSQMEIVSGVYIYVVEKLDGPSGKPNGEKAVGKFVIIK